METKITVRVGKIDQINRAFGIVDIVCDIPPPKKDGTILLLDTSGSMAPYIEDVAQGSKAYIAELPDAALVSVAVYSGHNESRLIAGPVECTKTGREMLERAIDSEVRVRSVTVFSEPLALTLETVKRLAGKDTVHNAVLFTDGCPVPTAWSYESECQRSYEAARKLKEAGVVVSVIGYGVYYNIEFINALMAAAGNTGVYQHISEIDNFRQAIEQIREVFLKTAPVDIALTFASREGTAGKLYRALPEVIGFGTSGRGNFRGVYEGKTSIFVDLSEPTTRATVTLNIDGATRIMNDEVPGAATEEDKATFVRILAANALLTGETTKAVELFDLAQDTEMVDKVADGWSNQEQRENADWARKYFRDRRFIGAGLKEAEKSPNHNLINYLRMRVEDPEVTLFIPPGAYKRSGVLTVDPAVIQNPLGRKLEVKEVSIKVDRANVNLLCRKDIQVRPRDPATKEFIPGAKPIDTHCWRTYNVVLDGDLRIPELLASLSQKSFEMSQAAGRIPAHLTYDPAQIYTINLRGMKTFSSAWTGVATLGLLDLFKEEAELESEQTALNRRRTELGAKSKSGTFDGDTYYPSEKVPEGLVLEYYDAPCCEWKLMGYKARDYDVSGMNLEAANTRVEAVRKRLRDVRFFIGAIRLSCEFTKSRTIRWGQPLPPRKNSKKEVRQATLNGFTLQRDTWTEECVCA